MVLVFEGSHELLDWIDVLRIGPTSSQIHVKVHQYYNQIFCFDCRGDGVKTVKWEVTSPDLAKAYHIRQVVVVADVSSDVSHCVLVQFIS